MAESSVLHPLLLVPHHNPVLEDLERQQRDSMVAQIAGRIRSHTVMLPERRCVKTTIRPLAFPCWTAGIMATCVATVYYVQSRPRTKTQERFWFASVKDAKAAFPKSQLLDEAPCVARPARA